MKSLLLPSARALLRFAIGIIVVGVLGAAASPVAAQSQVKILVNDKPITTYDIQMRTQMLKVFSRGKEGEKQAIEQLINERLMLDEAARVGMEVTEAQVEQEFGERARRAKLSAAQFGQAMRQAGIDPQTFRNFIRANMAWGQIVRARFKATVEVTDQDVTAALTGREEAAADQATYEYMLQQIVFIVPAGAGAGAEAQQRSQAAAFRGGYQGCEQTIQQVAGKAGVVVKPTVRREESALNPELKEALGSLEVGGISEPMRVPEGIQLVGVCAKQPITGQTQAAQEVRSELSNERGQLLARRYLRDLRSDAAIEYR